MPLTTPIPPQEKPALPPAGEHPSDGGVPLWRSGAVLGLAVFLLVLCWINPPPTVSPQAGVVMELPNVIQVPNLNGGTFHGVPAEVTLGERTVLPADTEFARKNYDDFSGHNVFLSIVLSGLGQSSIHRPEVCLDGQGWNIVNQEDFPIQLASGHNLVVRNLTIERDLPLPDGQRRHVRAFFMYWFVGENVTTPWHATRVFESSWDRIVHGRAHRWAYVIAMAGVTEGQRADGLDPEETKQMLADFIRQAVPAFQKSEMAAPAGG